MKMDPSLSLAGWQSLWLGVGEEVRFLFYFFFLYFFYKGRFMRRELKEKGL